MRHINPAVHGHAGTAAGIRRLFSHQQRRFLLGTSSGLVYGRMDLSKKSELLKSSRIAPLYLGFCWYVCVCVYIITYVCIYIYRDKTLYSIYKLMDLENPKGCDQLPVPNDLEMMLMTGVIPKIAQHGLCDLCVFHLISGSIATCSTYLYTASGIFG